MTMDQTMHSTWRWLSKIQIPSVGNAVANSSSTMFSCHRDCSKAERNVALLEEKGRDLIEEAESASL